MEPWHGIASDPAHYQSQHHMAEMRSRATQVLLSHERELEPVCMCGQPCSTDDAWAEHVAEVLFP